MGKVNTPNATIFIIEGSPIAKCLQIVGAVTLAKLGFEEIKKKMAANQTSKTEDVAPTENCKDEDVVPSNDVGTDLA